MDIQAMNNEEIREASIYVYNRPGDPLRYVRCVEDGNLLLEVKGQVAYVIVGLNQPHKIIKINSAYLRVKCNRCKVYYSILVQNI